jgi:hypothetical protein
LKREQKWLTNAGASIAMAFEERRRWKGQKLVPWRWRIHLFRIGLLIVGTYQNRGFTHDAILILSQKSTVWHKFRLLYSYSWVTRFIIWDSTNSWKLSPSAISAVFTSKSRHMNLFYWSVFPFRDVFVDKKLAWSFGFSVEDLLGLSTQRLVVNSTTDSQRLSVVRGASGAHSIENLNTIIDETLHKYGWSSVLWGKR